MIINFIFNNMKKTLIKLLLIFVLLIISIKLNGQNSYIQNGQVWNDSNGKPINAHGGGIMYHKGTYYLFGEIKTGRTWRVPNVSWECYRTEAGGVSCYSSKNLKDWEYKRVALTPSISDSTSDIHRSKVIERPKVIYNKKTNKFVMWMHVDSEDYSYAKAGVAISDKPEGPYKYITSYRPNNQMSRDMTLFKDDDGKAYLIYSSENNSTMHVCLLTDDYLQPSTDYVRIFKNESREAPAIFKHENKYYLITSGCTGWSPNEASYSVADSIQGHWKTIGNPFIGKNAEITFFAQSTYVIPIKRKKNGYVFMADIWNKTNLEDSRYLWLPFKVKNNSKLTISWLDKWNMFFFK